MAIVPTPPPIQVDPDTGDVVINMAADALNFDWIRSARLVKQAAAGDRKAKAEIAQLETTPTVWEDNR